MRPDRLHTPLDPARAVPGSAQAGSGMMRLGSARWTAPPPAHLTTLAAVQPDETAEVRSILIGAGESAALLLPGDVLVCRGRTADWVIVERVGRGEVAIHRHDARHVQIERDARGGWR